MIKNTWETIEYISVYGFLEIYNLRDVFLFPYEIRKGSISLIRYCKTFKFYIGETKNLKATKRITRHKTSLKKVVSLIRNQESISSFARYPSFEQMVPEIIKPQSGKVTVSCLENFDVDDKKRAYN